MPATMPVTPVIPAAEHTAEHTGLPSGLPPGHRAAIDAINQAPISRPIRCTARRLLDRAGPDGVCVVPRTALLELCDTPYADTVRHHLAQLKKAGLIHCSVRDVAFIQFIACTAQPQPSRPAPVTPTAERTAPPAASVGMPTTPAPERQPRSPAPLPGTYHAETPARATPAPERQPRSPAPLPGTYHAETPARATPAPERQPRSPAALPGTYRAESHHAPQPTQHTTPRTQYAPPPTAYAAPRTDPPPPSTVASVIAATGQNLNWNRPSSRHSYNDSDAPESDATAAICGLLADFEVPYPLCRRLARCVPVPVVEAHVRDYRARVAADKRLRPEVLLNGLRALLA